MSVKEKVLEVAKITQKRGEEEQAFLQRCVQIIQEMSDADWAALGQDAQEWFNGSVESMNAGKDATPFPEEKKAAARGSRSKKTEEAPATQESVIGAEVKVTSARGKEVIGTIVEIDADAMVVKDYEGEEHFFLRSRVKAVEFLNQTGDDDSSSAEPAVGDDVILTTKRGTTTEGKIVEMDDDVVILDTGNGQDTEFARSRIGSMVLVDVAGIKAEEESPVERDPVVGDMVVVVTKRGKEVKGTVVEVDGDTLVVGVSPDGEETETDMSTAQSITITSPVKAPAPARGRKATQEELPLESTKASSSGVKKEEGKKTKISAKANGGVSSSVRMKELICADPEITKDALAKSLKAEKLEYNENTLIINFKLVNDVIELLKKNKHFK